MAVDQLTKKFMGFDAWGQRNHNLEEPNVFIDTFTQEDAVLADKVTHATLWAKTFKHRGVFL